MFRVLLFITILVPSAAYAAADDLHQELQTLKRRMQEIESQISKSSNQTTNAFNPRITAFGDFVGRADNRVVNNDEGDRVSDRLLFREFELDMRADVDPYAGAVAILGVEQEATGSNTAIALEEGYLNIRNLPGYTLPRGSFIKAGKFKAAFGVLNRLHVHDYPQTTLPLPNREFLGEEGFAEFGVSLNMLVPAKHEGGTFNFTAEFLNGTQATLFAGHANSRDPAYGFRSAYSRELGEQSFAELGGSLLIGNNDAAGNQTTKLWGSDLLYKWRTFGDAERVIPLIPLRLWSVVLQAEYFYMDREDNPGRTAWGGYGMLQLQPTSRLYLGGRYDITQDPANKSLKTRKAGGYFSFYTTEFLRFRVGYEFENIPPAEGRDRSTIYGQITFVYGSHPAEPYWFSK